MQTFIGALLLTLSSTPPGQESTERSPHFSVSGDPAVDRLPLERTSARIQVSGVVAHVRLSQTYKNEGSRPIEAVYVFPVSTRGAVFGMKMQLGDRTIRAEIREKKEARKEYEDAKHRGQTASLLEGLRPSVLELKVANILPGDRVEVEVDYFEVLTPTEAEYELVLPMVVGPRYTGGTRDGANHDPAIAATYLPEGLGPTHQLSLTAHIDAGVPIQRMESPSHRVVSVLAPRGNPHHAELALDEPEGANRDFVLRYRLGQDAPTSGVLLHEGSEEQFFLAMLQPPAKLEPTAVPPRELIYIVDVSCSMGGFPLDTAKSFIRASLDGLRPVDRFNLMFFSGGNTVLSKESLAATPENLARAQRMLSDQSSSGGTEIQPALEQALRMRRGAEVSTSFVVVTDGYVSVEKETFALIRRSLGRANLFAFGIGTSVNRHLIEGMARAGMGEPFVVQNESEATGSAAKLVRLLDAPVLTRVKVDFDGFDAYDVVPESLPDLFVDRPVLIFGKFRGPARGHIRVEGYNAHGRYSAALDVERAAAPDGAHRALRHLWARHAIQSLQDEAGLDPTRGSGDRIRDLGLRYGLLTEHTSFVAIDSAKRNHDGEPVVVEQPLPLPMGVGRGALGGVGVGGGGVGYGAGGLGLRGAGKSYFARGVRAPRITTAQPIVTGSIDRKAVVRVLQPALRRLRLVYQKARLARAELQGRVVVQLTIEPDGRVSTAKLSESNLAHPQLEQAILRELGALVFPSGSGVVIINYPIVFQPGD